MGVRTGWRRGHRLQVASAPYVGALLLGLLLAATALAATGGLVQKPGAAGCVSATGAVGSAASCTRGIALGLPGSVVVTADGRNVYVASVGSDAFASFDRESSGALSQKPGTGGCISETGNGGACADGTALDGARSITVSPDGTSAYGVSRESNALDIFDRDPSTGALTQKPGLAGCISDSGTGGACVDGTALDHPESVAISPDGTSVYVASLLSNAIDIFDRNPINGRVTQKSGTAGCISETGSAGACADGTALNSVEGVTVSADGANVYVASASSEAIAIFDRAKATGALTQKAGVDGCISDTGTGGACSDGTALRGAFSVAVSPDDANVYVGSEYSDAVASFNRAPATGALAQKPGAEGCISKDGSGGVCRSAFGLDAAGGVTVSPDGTNVYVAASDDVAILDRDTASGALTQRPYPEGCVSETGTGGTCADGTALDGAVSVAVSPEGASLYLTAFTSSAIAIFDRERVLAPGDTTPPDLTVIKRPRKRLTIKRRTAGVRVTFSSEPGAIFTCTLDRRPARPCSSPFKVRVTSARGKGKKHTIRIVATDAAGNSSRPVGVSTTVVRRKRR